VELIASGPGIEGGERVRTDAQGLARFRVASALESTSQRTWTVRLDDGRHRGVARTGWSQGASPYQLGVPVDFYPRSHVGFLYLDRPIYRPGETVHVKGIVRSDDDATYSVPAVTARVVLNDSRFREIAAQDVQLNELGTFAVEFQLAADAAVGGYRVSVERDRSFLFAREFSVSEFRVP
jgi:uncharacterized protein YfaS (alpha-2-macroglobulin family)